MNCKHLQGDVIRAEKGRVNNSLFRELGQLSISNRPFGF